MFQSLSKRCWTTVQMHQLQRNTSRNRSLNARTHCLRVHPHELALSYGFFRFSERCLWPEISGKPLSLFSGRPIYRGQLNARPSLWVSCVYRKARKRLPSMTGIRILFRTSLFRNLSVCIVLNGIVFEGNQDFTFLYMQEHLGFTQDDQQTTFVLLGASLLLTQVVILPAMLRYMKETRVLLIGMSFSLVQQAWLIFLNHKIQGIMALCVGSFSMLVFPSIGTLKANSVSSEEQGQIQGALYGAQALGKGAGPVLYNSVYRLFTKSVYGTPYIPVSPFIFGTVISSMGVGIAAKICRNHKQM